MIISGERLSIFDDLCQRRYVWLGKYHARVPLVKALYHSIDAGLMTAKENPDQVAENELLALAANPGLDVTGHDVYAIAMHYAKLAGILTAVLRSASSAPWRRLDELGIETPIGTPLTWRSACYDAGDGIPRRIVLVDRWSEDRKLAERRNWRTLGEAVALDRSIVLTAIAIGQTYEKRRVSPWTKAYRHPGNRTLRYRKRDGEAFGSKWLPIWRENSDLTTLEWLEGMQHDGCMDQIASVKVPVPERREDYLAEMLRIASEMENIGEVPPMRLAGCHGFSKCPFTSVCFGAKPPLPENYGFSLRPQTP